MRIEEIKIYKYEELSEEAKERVKRDFLDCEIRNDIFSDNIKCDLKEDFPNSELHTQYSLGYCQGDGLNIYGTLDVCDIVDKLDMTDKEKRAIKFYAKYDDNDAIMLSANTRYAYSVKFIHKKSDEWVKNVIYELEYNDIKNINEDVLVKFFNSAMDYMEDLEKKYEKDGYDFLHNIDEEEMQDMCDCSEYEFYEDGKLF